MRPERETRINGMFEGWSPNELYRLMDGSRWKLGRARASRAAMVRPAVKVWRYEGRFYLELVENGEFAEVQQVL